MMTKSELSKILDGREYGNETEGISFQEIRNHNLVVLFGYSDDNMEFRGAIYEEIGCYGGRTIHLNNSGIIKKRDCFECDDCELYRDQLKQSKTITAVWDTGEYAWEYKTDIPHETFDIMEDGEKFCKGIVFSLNDL